MRSCQNAVRLATFALIGLALGGCGVTAKFTYPADAATLARVSGSKMTHLTVAVEPFTDYRGNENSDWFAMCLLPLAPYGWVTYERPDAARQFLSIREYDTNPPEDLAKAVALSLKESGLFKSVYFSYGGATSESADIVVTGTVAAMTYEGKKYSYCVSILTPCLLLLGLPLGTSRNTLQMELTFTHTKSGATFRPGPITTEWSKLQGLYYGFGHDCRGFSITLQEALNELVRTLANTNLASP